MDKIKKLNILDWLCIIGIVAMIALQIYFKNLKSIGGVISLIIGVFGVTTVLLNSKKFKYVIILYTIHSIAYAIDCYFSKQYGITIVHAFITVPLYIIGFIRLIKNKDNPDALKINKLNKRGYFLMILAFLGLTIVFCPIVYYLSKRNNTGLVLMILNVLYISTYSICSFLTSKNYFDQWMFWIINNFIAFATWILGFLNSNNPSDLVYLIMNFVYLGINIGGYINWKKLYKQQLEYLGG